jgi:hypothetical protein
VFILHLPQSYFHILGEKRKKVINPLISSRLRMEVRAHKTLLSHHRLLRVAICVVGERDAGLGGQPGCCPISTAQSGQRYEKTI